MAKKRNAFYWMPVPGQLSDDEGVDSGYRAEWEAWRAKDALQARWCARVVELRTIEHDLPADNPAHEPFESTRWCVVYKH